MVIKTIRERLSKIAELLLGKKCYVVVVHRTGTDMYQLCSTLFTSREHVELYKMELLNLRSVEYVETVTFRSYVDYVNVR